MNLALLSKMSSRKEFAKDEVIIWDGDIMGNEMYIILQGSVSVYKNYKEPNEIRLRTMHPGAFFGEMTLFLHKQRTATVVALEPTIVLVINRMNAYEFFEQQPEASAKLAATLYERLENVNKNGGIADDLSPFLPKEYEKYDWSTVNFAGKNPEESYKVIQVLCEALDKINNVAVRQKALADFFPAWHKKMYSINIEPPKSELLYEKWQKCPICEQEITVTLPKQSKLKTLRVDRDFRTHYEGIEVVFYDVITCPECHYSDFWNKFPNSVLQRFRENIREIRPYKEVLGLNPGAEKDINDVFAGLYLVIKCAPLFSREPYMAQSRAWLRLHWLYEDCKDATMSKFAMQQALHCYLFAYEKAELSAEALQQLCITIGELSFKLNDIPTAKQFLLKARSNKGGKDAMVRQAADRLMDIREMEKRGS